jgi:aminoglycoside phosphotransferase (APT) family kinase protein
VVAPPGEGREGDRARIEAALATAGQPDPRPSEWRLSQLAGGWSRHTFVLSPCGSDGGSLVVRVKPAGGLLSSDLETEYRVYRSLRRLPIPLPGVHGLEPASDTPFGGPFLVMDWMPGAAPNVWLRPDREGMEARWQEGDRGLAGQFASILASIHSCEVSGLDFLGPMRSFHEVVEGWRSTYEDMRLVRDPVVEEAFRWVDARCPPDPHLGLVHGDYRIGNMLVHEGRVTAVLDWELTHLGDTDFDLGYLSLDYVAGKFLHAGSPLASAVADRGWLYAEYERLTGRRVDREVVRTYSAVGALMLITILVTGARMYADGKTDDQRMAWNRYAIPGLRQDLTRLMGW